MALIGMEESTGLMGGLIFETARGDEAFACKEFAAGEGIIPKSTANGEGKAANENGFVDLLGKRRALQAIKHDDSSIINVLDH